MITLLILGIHNFIQKPEEEMRDERNINRRSFLGRTTATGAALSAFSAMKASAAPAWDSARPFRVGCLNVDSYSHLMDLWAPLINPRKGQKDTPFTGMRITHCWEIERARAEKFAASVGCEVVDNFDGMVGKVDGIISGGFYNHGWNHILHEPYLEAGLPNLVNRPFANSLAKAKKMLETAKRYNAAILCPSSHEWNNSTYRAKEWAVGKTILCYNATNSFDDYPTHGVHGLYMCCKAIAEAGNPVVSVSYRSDKWYSPSGVMTFEHKDKDGKQFFGTLHQVSGSWATINIHTPEAYGGQSFNVEWAKDSFFSKTEVWAPVIWAYQDMAMYGSMPQTYDQIYHKTNVFLAGWYSILERGGQPVRLEEVPEDWESPVALPNHPDDTTVALFRQKFGA